MWKLSRFLSKFWIGLIGHRFRMSNETSYDYFKAENEQKSNNFISVLFWVVIAIATSRSG